MGSYHLIATIPAKAGIHPWDAGEAPAPFPPLGTRFRGHDDGWTRRGPLHLGEGARYRRLALPPSAFVGAVREPPLLIEGRERGNPQPSFLRKRESISQARRGPLTWVRGPLSSVGVAASPSTAPLSKGVPSFLPPSRFGGGPAPTRFRGHIPQARRGPLG